MLREGRGWWGGIERLVARSCACACLEWEESGLGGSSDGWSSRAIRDTQGRLLFGAKGSGTHMFRWSLGRTDDGLRHPHAGRVGHEHPNRYGFDGTVAYAFLL